LIDCKKSPPLSGIDVAILVGGLGTRLRGVVDDVPKPFAPVLSRPFVFYILDMLARHGARSVTLCSGYMADIVREKTGNEWHGIPVHHSVETEPLGTAGALANAKEFLKSRRVLVMNGDTWCEPDFKTLLESGSPADFLIVVVEVPDASRYGTLKIDPSGRLLAFVEKSQLSAPSLINAGMYVVSQEILASLPKRKTSLETQILPGLVNEGRVQAFITASPFLDIGIPSDYAAASDFLKAAGLQAEEIKISPNPGL
jgi:D-glycero-alpha-D-manno-heptose 1-phosphate guanylyltransferase